MKSREDVELHTIREGKFEGYIDSAGKVVIRPRFARASEFSEGLACVQMGEPPHLQAFIDASGKEVIPPGWPSGFEPLEGDWSYSLIQGEAMRDRYVEEIMCR